MNILIAVDQKVSSALTYWLHSQGHQTHTSSVTACSKLVLDYLHLRPFLWSKQPIPHHWPSPEHWLLLDTYLQPTQLIAAMHMGLRHISLAPIQAAHLKQWLTSQPNIVDLNCDWPAKYEPKAEIDPMLLPFIKCIMRGVWSEEEKMTAAKTILWRNVALQSGQYQRLNETSRLDAIEFSQLAYHTLAGANWLQHYGHIKAAVIARQHHEHWDGSGYPMAVAGAAICLEARLAKLYDSYIGLRRAKTYAKACDHRTSINKLTYGDGYLNPSQFDPQLLTRFLQAEATIETLYSLGRLAN
jgi:hypothetical protein|tara:strand:+ start:1055 stop:1951 length:897 start_codon:yes stop_codon:yes gene_type:complete